MNPNIIVTEPLEVPDIPGIGYYYFQCMKNHAKLNKVAQVDGLSEQVETYESLLKRCIRTSLFLLDHGIKKDDVVCLFSPNNMDSCVPFISSHFIGAIPTCIVTSLSEADIKDLINLVKPKIFFTTPEHIDFLENIVKQLEIDVSFIIFGDSDKHFQFSDVLKSKNNEDTFSPTEIKDTKDTAILYFSSGTSGLPKAVCINHYTMLYQVRGKQKRKNPDEVVYDMESFGKHNTVFLVYSSLYWISGGMNLLLGTCHGLLRVVLEHFDPTQVWNIIEKFKVNFMMASPWMALDMTKFRKPDNVNISSLLSIVIAGSRAPSEVVASLKEQLPLVTIHQAYGQTEVAGTNLYFDVQKELHRKYLKEKPDSVGLPAHGMIHKVVDPETNEILGPNQEGELRIKGQTMMNGYYNMDSSEYFDEEGFYKTGDIVYYDNDHCFYVVDRIKEIFKYKNIHISPFQIQEVVLQHPDVKQAAVFGYPHPEDQYHAVAAVVLNDNSTATPEEIRDFVDSRVDDTKKLRGGVKFVKSLPMTPTGKVKVRDLKIMMDKNLI